MKIYERKKDHVNRHNQFRPNRGTVVALKMKIYERKKVMVKRHNQFRPNRGTIVALKMKIYERKKDHVNQHNQFRPNRGTIVALKMKIYERKKGSCKSAQPIQTEKINTNLSEGQKTRAKNFSCRPGAPFSALCFLRFTFPGSAPRCLYNSRSPTRSLFHPVRDPR